MTRTTVPVSARLGAWIAIGTLGLLPLVFLPATQAYADTNKWFFLMAGSLATTGAWALASVTGETIRISWSPAAKRLATLAVVALLGLFVRSPNRTDALLSPFGPATWTALFLLTALGASAAMRLAILSGASIAALLAIYQFFGLGSLMFPGVSFLADSSFTLVGSSAGLAAILLMALPLAAEESLRHHRGRRDIPFILSLAMVSVLTGGLTVTALILSSSWTKTTLPYSASWAVLLESMKSTKNLLLGAGAENFLAAFTLGRPVWLNMTDLWNARFTTGSSLLFHLSTVYGAAGAAASLFFLHGLLFPRATIGLRLGLAAGAIVFLLFPPSLASLAVMTTLLAASTAEHSESADIRLAPALRFAGAGVILFGVFVSSYGVVRAYRAELAFGRSLAALASRNGTEGYNQQLAAMRRNPGRTAVHLAASQTSLALAKSWPDPDATASAGMQTQLVKQAIAEGKLAVELAPEQVIAWENLASVYQALVGIAQGADAWTIAAYQKAVSLDPTNPSLRLRLGGAYAGATQWDRAQESYRAAIELKPDYANAYYNLAFALREQKKYLQAAQALKETVAFINPDSPDAARAEKELEQLTELLTEEEKLSLQ